MKLTKISEAIMNATRVAKMCRGQVALSACICAAICLSPATAEESQEVNEDGEEIVENALQNEEETEEPQIDFSKETAAALQEAEIEINTGEGEETDGDKTSVKEVVSAEDLYDGTIPEGAVGGGASTASVQVPDTEEAEELNIPHDANADIIAETLNIATETSDNTASNDSVIAAVNSETETSAAVAAVQQSYSSSTDEASTLSTESTGQNDSSVYLVIEGDTGISTFSSSGNTYSTTTSTESTSTIINEKEVIVTQELEINSGEKVIAQESLIVGTPGQISAVKVKEGAELEIGTDEVGVIKIQNSTYQPMLEDYGIVTWATITDAKISVTENNVTFTRYKDDISNAKVTAANIDLSGISKDATITIENITLSDIQFNQPNGSLYLKHSGLSLTEPSTINNIHVDYYSDLFGSNVSGKNKLTGQDNYVEFAPLPNGPGHADDAAINGETIGSWQLYGLTLTDGVKITTDLQHVNLDDSLLTNGGNFYIEYQGTMWIELIKEIAMGNSSPVITDKNIIDSTFVLTNFNGLSVEELKKYLSIDSVSYQKGTQGIVLEISVQPMDVVPEPATATLSLLALTALAARRRRRV